MGAEVKVSLTCHFNLEKFVERLVLVPVCELCTVCYQELAILVQAQGWLMKLMCNVPQHLDSCICSCIPIDHNCRHSMVTSFLCVSNPQLSFDDIMHHPPQCHTILLNTIYTKSYTRKRQFPYTCIGDHAFHRVQFFLSSLLSSFVT